jgi:hypothetical protein
VTAAASWITAPLAGAAEAPDVPTKPIPAATSIAIKIVRIRFPPLCFYIRDCHKNSEGLVTNSFINTSWTKMNKTR